MGGVLEVLKRPYQLMLCPPMSPCRAARPNPSPAGRATLGIEPRERLDNAINRVREFYKRWDDFLRS